VEVSQSNLAPATSQFLAMKLEILASHINQALKTSNALKLAGLLSYEDVHSDGLFMANPGVTVRQQFGK